MHLPLKRSCGAGLGFASAIALLIATNSSAVAGDRQDSPNLDFTALFGQVDLASLYVFRSPTNANNTVLILLAGPHAQLLTRPFFDPKARYDFKIDSTEDLKPDLTFRAKFSAPDENGVQKFKLQRMVGRKPFKTIATGNTAVNLPIEGGGMTRAGLFDDPFFFDAWGYNDFVADGVGNFPRAAAKNYYGLNGNILGVVIEVPSSTLVKDPDTANGAVIAVWGRVIKNGAQIDRVGRPLTSLALIPPMPRNAEVPDLRKRFNKTQPRSDRRLFDPSAVEILRKFFGRTEEQAINLSSDFLPDVQYFQIGNPNGFGTFVVSPIPDSPLGTVVGNGRRLRDDTVDIVLSVFTGNILNTDNISDDNGTRITDGNMGTTAAFPYIGAANLIPSGPNP